MPRALPVTETFEYVLERDQAAYDKWHATPEDKRQGPEPVRTRFRLRRLTVGQRARVDDLALQLTKDERVIAASGTKQKLALNVGLDGVEDFFENPEDAPGERRAVPFDKHKDGGASDAFLDRLHPADRGELANQVLQVDEIELGES